jgi:arylformamidase
MTITLNEQNKIYQADLSMPIDISIPIQEGDKNPSCYGADAVQFKTIESGNFIGSVALGGSVNYQKLTITPHGNGTHTESVGHIIADSTATINRCLTTFHSLAHLISVSPERSLTGDQVITKKILEEKLQGSASPALVIRTLPNAETKKNRHYTATNPPYLESDAVAYLVFAGVQHLLIDLPSIDPEVDGGKLSAHKTFWNLPTGVRRNSTITELVFVPDTVPDGRYLLNLQIISLEMDASPSKPVLYKLTEVL